MSSIRLSTGAALQLLALELLKILLENSGPVFRHSERFIAAIKQYLCLSLLKNVTSSVSQAQALTCSIFFTLLVKFRQSLKAEIGVFFPIILLRAVEPAAQGATPNTGGENHMYRASAKYLYESSVSQGTSALIQIENRLSSAYLRLSCLLCKTHQEMHQMFLLCVLAFSCLNVYH